MATILKVESATNAPEHLARVNALVIKDSTQVREYVKGATTAARPVPLGRAIVAKVAIECVIIED